MAEVKISELPVADQANVDDLLEASQVVGSGYASRHISLDQVSTVVAASDQITDAIDVAIGELPPPTTAWADITGKPATFPPTVPIAWTDVSGKPTTFPPDPEAVDDRVAALIVAGSNMTATYNDAANTLTLASTASGGGGGTVTSTSVVSANGLAGTVATPTTTPAITLSTTVTGMLKGNGTAISAGLAGTDYVIPGGLPTSLPPSGAASGDLAGTYPSPTVKASVGLTGTPTAPTATPSTTNTTQIATTAFVQSALPTTLPGPPTGTAGGDLSGTYPNPTIKPGSNTQVLTTTGGVAGWATPAGGGTVTTVSIVSANGLAGTVATATTTPAITLSTTVNGLVKGNGTTLSAATAGTDYVAPGGAGVQYLYNETVLGSAAATIACTIPANCKSIDIEFAVFMTTGTDTLITLQLMQGATPVSSGYIGAQLYGTGTVAGSNPIAAAGLGVITGLVGVGTCKIFNNNGNPSFVMTSHGASTTINVPQVTSGSHAATYASITGARIICAASTFRTGGYIRSFVVT